MTRVAPATDTIAAIATPPGRGGIGIVRISGPRAFDIAQALCGKRPAPRQACFARFRDAAGDELDHGLLLLFEAPHSYTGEDVAELQVHGSPVQLQALLRRVEQLGARAARPGEFSERAFLNDKLDLAQAEAIADLIAAGSEAAARAALRSLSGAFSARVDALLQELIALRVYVEAALDFPEEEIDFLAEGDLAARLQALRDALRALLQDSERGVRLTDGLHVVLLGRPNAGKSSLLNALAGEDRAIVTEIAGTTRDLLRETVDIGGVGITVVDTAGLRDARDAIEAEGVRRARAESASADLALIVLDAARGERAEPLLAELPGGLPAIVLHNKQDLLDAAGAPAHDAAPERQLDSHATQMLKVSARDGRGLDALRALLRQRAGVDETGTGTFSARVRHLHALRLVDTHLRDAAVQLTQRHGELLAEELRHAQGALGAITGEFGADALLGEIFGSFCIGK